MKKWAKKLLAVVLSVTLLVGGNSPLVSEAEGLGEKALYAATQLEGFLTEAGIGACKEVETSCDLGVGSIGNPSVFTTYSSQTISSLTKEIKAAWDKKSTSLNISSYGISTSDLASVYFTICYDNPEYFYVKTGFSYSYNTSNNKVTYLSMKFGDFSSSEIEEFQSTVNSIVSMIDSSWSAEEKALFLHDYIVRNCDYDVDSSKMSGNSKSRKGWNAYYCLVDHLAVCEGYSKAYKLLCNKVGIDCKYVVSDSLNHAWNLIKLNGTYYHVDCTYDDPVGDYPEYVGHKCFLRSNSGISEQHGGNYYWYIFGTTMNLNSCSPGSDYDTYYWTECISPIVPIDREWGYIDSDNTLSIYNYLSNSNYYLTEFSAAWNVWNSSATYTSAVYAGLAASEDYFYYSDSTNIYRCDLSGNTECIYSLSSSEQSIGYIYGIRYEEQEGVLYYDLSRVPNVSGYMMSVTTHSIDVEEPEYEGVVVSYQTHIQSIGWQKNKKNGAMSGTIGLSKRLEAIKITVSGDEDLGIQYSTHCQTYGWLPWAKDGELSGTEGESKRLEAIEMVLTGADAENYDIYYRVHAQSYGWLGWAKNGEPAGTAGYSKRLEAIQIVVVEKDSGYPGDVRGIESVTTEAYVKSASATSSDTAPGQYNTNVSYRTHVQTYGWQGWKYNGTAAGTFGESKRLESMYIRLTNQQYSGSIRYKTQVQKYGWLDWAYDGALTGTSGESKRLEAICIELTGEMAEHYDIYYRVHAQTYGWMGWAKNGEKAGTAGCSKRLEAIQIVLVEKGGEAPGATYAGITGFAAAEAFHSGW